MTAQQTKSRHSVANIAGLFSSSLYAGAVHEIPEGADRRTWAKAVHYNWSVEPAPLRFMVDGKAHEIKERVALQRSDTHALLGIVAPGYKPVQPKAILSFYEEVADEFGFKLEAAGQAQAGRKLWALARTPYTVEVASGDKVDGFLMFLTGCDGTSATKLLFTSFRGRCLNQLRIELRAAMSEKQKKAWVTGQHVLLRLTHRSTFSHQKAKESLAIMEASWKEFERRCKALAKLKVTDKAATNFLLHLAYPNKALDEIELEKLRESSVGARLLHTYKEGVGQKGIVGTGWGLVNAATRFVDHEARAKNSESRITRAWVTSGARQKTEAFNEALKLLEAK
jgi:phage/plasmid-like protein (TIGR03299 family)